MPAPAFLSAISLFSSIPFFLRGDYTFTTGTNLHATRAGIEHKREEREMYRSLTEQMQSFSLAIQQAMIRNVQSTLVKQLEIFQAMQKPFVSQGLKLGSSMQHIMLEQIRMLNTGLQTPMAEQLNEFSSSVQRIMAEQLQIFAASTPSPTPA
ncbi:MAG: hypothetical protein KDI18_09875, partial [Gammaproteobacteria bacterium]|nr:hypothetical protein [Gammaproteobacteria bacterium]